MTGYKRNHLYIKAKEIFNQDVRDVKLDIQLTQWNEVMRQSGFIHLGSGSHGSAYMWSNYQWVFKIFRGDSAYLSFIDYIKQNQWNQNIPKIKGGVIKINSDTYLVRIEKLSPLSLGEYLELSVDIKQMIESVLDQLSIDELSSSHKSAIKKFPGIYNFLQYWYSNINYELDIREPNIMKRGNVPVLLDPVAL